MTPISRFPIAGLSQAQRPALWRGDFYQLRDGGLAHSAYDIFVVDAPQATSRRYKGLPIVASISGTVPLRVDRTGTPGSGTSDRGGNFVWIADPADPTGRTYHYFAHLKDPPLVQPGDTVIAGQLIGYLGDSGNARGRPHLHFSVRRPSGAVDVFDQLKAVERSAWLPPVSTGLFGQPWQRWAKVGIGASLAAGAALIAIYYLWPKTRAANPHRLRRRNGVFDRFRGLPADPDRGSPLHQLGYAGPYAASLGDYWTVPVDVSLSELASLKPVVQQRSRLASVKVVARLGGTRLPPIEVGVYGDGSGWLIDGNHRLAEARKARLGSIPVVFTFGKRT